METDTLYEDCQDLNEKLRINVVGNYAQGKSTLTRRLLVNRTVDKAYNETGENYYSTSNCEKKNVSEQTSWIDLGAALLNERKNEENESIWRLMVVGNYAQGTTTLTRRLLENLTVDKAYNETGENYYSTSLKHRVQEETKRIDHLIQPSGLVFVSIAGLYRTGKSYLMNRLCGKMYGWVEAYHGSGEKNFMSNVLQQTLAFQRITAELFKQKWIPFDFPGPTRQAQMFELTDTKFTLWISEVNHWLIFLREQQMIEDRRSRMERYMMNIFQDGNDWMKYPRAPTCLRHELLFTDSGQDDSQIGPREKTSKSSREKEWTNPPRAATILLRVSAVTIIYVGQIGQGEQKSKSSGEKEWMNHPRAANILLRVSAETFVFSSGDVDKKGPKEKKSKSSMYKWEHSNCSETHNTAQQEYDKIRRCSVCLDKDACVLFFPCRHMTTCEGCADVVTDCPLCRLRIKGTVKINVV